MSCNPIGRRGRDTRHRHTLSTFKGWVRGAAPNRSYGDNWPLGFWPEIYTRQVRRHWTGDELRALRRERGVGRPPRKGVPA